MFVCVCFFKQKTAYEMRSSDWSSDVCSSDLFIDPAAARVAAVKDDLVVPALLLPAHCRKRDAVGKFFEDDLLHALKLALLVGREMIKVGAHCFHPVIGCAGWQAPSGASMVTTAGNATTMRSEEHTSELQSLMRISYAVFCLKKQKHKIT